MMPAHVPCNAYKLYDRFVIRGHLLRYRGFGEQRQSLKRVTAISIEKIWALVIPHWRIAGSNTAAIPTVLPTALIEA